MKRILLLFMLCFTIPTKVKAQERELNCESNFREALFYLEGDDTYKKDSLKSIEYLKPCIKAGDAKAQLLMAKLHLAKENEKNYKKAFKLLKKSAKQGNDIAMVDLGILYKYGRGCRLNFNKARSWFKKSATLGNDKALYSLGYLYLKGFGEIEQDYKKATKYFEKSKNPMAKYWLGVCYFYGYGVPKNIEKANKLLETHFEVISENLNDKEINTANTTSSSPSSLDNNSDNNSNIANSIENNQLLGVWIGTLLQLDWSAKHIEKKIPLEIEFAVDDIESIIYKLKTDNQEVTGNLTKIENTLYFEDLTLTLPHTSFNDEIPNSLFYEILSSNLSLKKLGEKEYLTGNLESYIADWKEAGKPTQFVLQKKESFNNSDNELSDGALKALSEQDESFIKLYPNPFENDLIISYTLDQLSYVEVSVSDINGTKNTILEKGKQQKKGKYNYFLNGSVLQKGLYIVSVTANNLKKTRIIVKK
jgi:hypothetical protein